MKRFIKNQDGTVTDTTTGLIFKVLPDYVNHAAAKKAIAELGEGWRMPDDLEALSIVDRSRHSPAADPEAFPEIGEGGCFWTDKPCSWDSTAVWVVGFGLGNVNRGNRHGNAGVLAVRSGSNEG